MNITQLRRVWYTYRFQPREITSEDHKPLKVTGPEPKSRVSCSSIDRYKKMLKTLEVSEVAFENYLWPSANDGKSWHERFVVLRRCWRCCDYPVIWEVKSDAYMNREFSAEILGERESVIRFVVDTNLKNWWKVN